MSIDVYSVSLLTPNFTIFLITRKYLAPIWHFSSQSVQSHSWVIVLKVSGSVTSKIASVYKSKLGANSIAPHKHLRNAATVIDLSCWFKNPSPLWSLRLNSPLLFGSFNCLSWSALSCVKSSISISDLFWPSETIFFYK
jgi:hypothetical protein